MVDLGSKFGRVVKQHLNNQYTIWLTTAASNLAPRPRLVWFIWEEDTFLIFSQPKAYKVKHITQNPKVSLHFNTDETGEEHVIVFVGEAALDVQCPPAHKVPAYLKKYQSGIADLNMTPEEFSSEYSTPIRIRPTEVRGWE